MVFLGTPSISAKILDFIIQEKKLKVQAVWTNAPKPVGREKEKKPTPVSRVAKQYNIPCYEVEKITQKDEATLKDLNSDFIFIVAFGKILPVSFFSIPTLGSFNLHFSLLPKYRGASPLQSAILHGEQETGITYQKINQKMDEGDIVLQEFFALDNMTYQQALQKALEVSKKNFSAFLEKIPQKKFFQQNHALASYCGKIAKRDGELKKNLTTKAVIQKFLAFEKWPGIYFYYKNEKYTIIRINLTPLTRDIPFNRHTGIIIERKDKKIYLSVKDGWVEVEAIQRQGRKKMEVKNFLNGTNLLFPIKLFS